MSEINLALTARNIRENIVNCIGSLGVGHIGGSLSIADLLAVLYGKHLKYDPKNPKMEGRDRLVCSKGHAGPAIYAVLAEFGFFDKAVLETLNQGGTTLPSHCDMNKTPGVDMTAGSLGQGFSCAVGCALGSKLRKDGATIYAIIGDGESQEGQIWEAGMYASHAKLDNLIAFTDYNKMQLDDYTANINDLDPLDKKWEAFGWTVVGCENGNDMKQMVDALTLAKTLSGKGKPVVVLMKTEMGYGVDFMQGTNKYHGVAPSNDELERALAQLNETLGDY